MNCPACQKPISTAENAAYRGRCEECAVIAPYGTTHDHKRAPYGMLIRRSPGQAAKLGKTTGG